MALTKQVVYDMAKAIAQVNQSPTPLDFADLVSAQHEANTATPVTAASVTPAPIV